MSFLQRRLLLLAAIVASLLLVLAIGSASADNLMTPIEQLGEFLYEDTNLSEPAGQACASCHHRDFGFVDPDSELPVSEGVVPGLFGGRNSPSAAYAMYSPILFFDEAEGLWIGGQFWDGRATGFVLGDPLADQALGPFLNPVEMANPNKAVVIADVAASDYAVLFEEVWGPGSLADVEAAYDRVALSIAAFERTELFAPFSSKYDHYLQVCMDMGGTPDDCATGSWKDAKKAAKVAGYEQEEWKGFVLFMGENDNDGQMTPGEGAMCSACHVADWTEAPAGPSVVIPAWSPDGRVPPLFTDFTFDNLGVPKSDHPLLQSNPVDLGLGPIIGDTAENGKFKVMTLRNIGLTEPYTHNGFFLTLKDITHFYNTRDVFAEGWDPAEVPETVNADELGNLGLSDADEDALVAFMRTLNDGYQK
jgi:cytochrome c peroxidase